MSLLAATAASVFEDGDFANKGIAANKVISYMIESELESSVKLGTFSVV